MQMKKMLKRKKCLSLKTFMMAVLMVIIAMPAKAQTRANEIRMKTGSETISDAVVYNFYDSGGAYVMDPELDPNNDYNWVSWYQHNESYLLHLINPLADNGKGIVVTFNYLLINNDHLKIYEGDLEDESMLIADLTCNDYSTSYSSGFTVTSHGNMTIRFTSDYHWRDAGWEALVELFTYTPKPPVALMQACDNFIELKGGSLGTQSTQIYYTLDGTDPSVPSKDPLSAGILYEGPIEITSVPVEVRAITVENGSEVSAVSSYTFTRLITPPAAPSINRISGTNKVIIKAPAVPADQNDTYYVRYSYDGTDPAYSDHENVKVDTVELTQPCLVRAVTRGTTCPDIFSVEDSLRISTIYVPTPEITITGTGDNGTATITCSLPGATIYYTINGTDPTTSTTTSGSSPITLSVPAGTTVKAMAYINNPAYVQSGIASAIYIPGGEGNNGVFGSVVLLDDREPHSWSYYSDGDQPVHSLKPADVKITYFGFGNGTMTTTDTGDEPTVFAGDVDAEDVAVGPNEAGNQFVYLKTLEATNEDGSGDYPYTLIPNPFSKRPAVAGATPTTRVVYLTTTGNRAGRGTLTVNYTNANGQSATETVNINSNNFNNTRYITTRVGTNITYTLTRTAGTVNSYGNYDASENNGGTRIWYATTNNNTQSDSYTIAAPAAEKDYRGFYAWRVKRLSNGLSIKDGDATLGVGSIIPAETEIKFVATANSTDNEVEFEALWAQAYVTTGTTAMATHANSYERNFHVLTSNAYVNNFSNIGYPLTISARYPDGSGNSTATVRLNAGCNLNNDLKLENISFRAGGEGNNLSANGYYLCLGRGINTDIELCNRLIGSNGSQKNHDFTIRAESGLIRSVYLTDGGVPNNYRFHCNFILGSDYDRAKKDNAKLLVAPSNQIVFGQGVISGAVNQSARTLDCVVKSGTFQSSYHNSNNEVGENTHSIYIGSTNGHNETGYAGKRYITVEGGEIANIAGGRGPMQADYAPVVTDTVVTVRIKGGTVHGSVYGGASSSTSYGSRKIVITGGEVQGWVATGCNSTSTGYGGVTSGTGNIYIGGNAVIGGSTPRTINGTAGGNVFGAGHGKDLENAASMSATCVVIADNADILHNVYGGGNYGYVYPTGQDAYDGEHKADLYILGGTVHENVFGGANMNEGQHVYITMNGGEVQGSVYGGSNTYGKIHEDAIITMNGGLVKGSVFGGGYGGTYDGNHDYDGTVMAKNTSVTVNGGTINGNVYGGGALGVVDGNTNVTVTGSTVNNVFGAGMGRAASTGVTALTANIGGTTTVNISGGTVAESVYGGGQNGNVKQANNPYNAKGRTGEENRDINPVSTVNVTGGNITNNVFGGGSMGFTNGGTVVNMSGGSVEGSVFGGAFGSHGKVYVAGQRTVNMRGGTVNRNVYGGSRNADDALTFIDDDDNNSIFNNDNTTTTASVVNMSGGYVHYQVFASGYFGNVFGSTYAFIGTNAILNAPNHVAPYGNYNADFYNAHQALRIGGSVWAGGDFGNYDGSKFGDPTVSGRSDVYIDGTGYDTESNNTTNTNYMYIGGSIYGSGTSCDAGRQGRHIILREYGQAINASQPTAALPYSSATRALYSIQRADSLVIDNAHVVLLGEGKINSLVTTEKYTVHEFQKVRISNGSSIFLNYPIDQIQKFGSYRVDDVYADEPTYTPVTYESSSLQATPNKIRVNNGSYIQVKYKYEDNTELYGELEGYAYMMSDTENNTCAYARPKQSCDQGNQIDPGYDNPLDGGWVSYDASLNTYSAGTLTNNAFASVSDAPGTVSGGVQMPYENHTLVTKNGEQYFRIWRCGGQYSYREGVFVAQSDGTSNFSTTDVIIDLPAFENCEEGTAYYRLKTLDGNTIIDYGTDVMTVNGACYDEVGQSDWMYINGDDANASFVTGRDSTDATLKQNGLKYIRENPNVNFGLVAIPSGGLAGNDNMLICEASDPKIATMQWANTANQTMPQVIFRLTYNNNLTNNVVWDPILITFEQVDCSGNVKATIDVALTVTTLTNIEQEFQTQAYAVVRGTGSATDTYVAKVVLPQYVMHVNTIGEISKWTCKSVEWEPAEGYGDDLFVGGTNYLNPNPSTCNNKFAMSLVAGLNFDNSTGWDTYQEVTKDMYGWNDQNYVFGETTARDPIGFDFTLQYDGRQRTQGNYQVGTLVFTMHFTNYEGAGAEPFEKDLIIKIDIWFLGQGVNYYIDGVHGNNLYSGKYPNAAKKTLSGIFNRTDYHAGDYIFIVDTVTANNSSLLTWNGKQYSEVTLYRYPGNHECVPNATGAESHYEGYDIETNACYTGPLVRVEKDMAMTGIILDGFYKESQRPEGEAAGDLTGYYHAYVPAEAPLVEIVDGGTLTVYGSSRLEYNYNSTTDGGGVYIFDGGVLNIYDGSAIDTNYVSSSKNGGGIYVNETSKVQLSDLVYITGNLKGLPSSKANDVENNVYLSTYYAHVDVGTVDTEDPYTMLLEGAKIGITKNSDWLDYWYAPVAESDGGQNYLSHLIGSDIMWDDQRKYELLALNNTHLQVPTDWLYFVGTWVTEVTENPQNPAQPNAFNTNEIGTPYELAWLISYVNGLNGASAHPDATATLTADIDMNANIWVPITNFTGTFNGNGHVVTGLRSPLNNENMGMFGLTQNATITDLVAQANFAGGTMKNIGTVIGTMKGGVLSNVEAAGILTGTATTSNIGGLVGQTLANGENKPTIHSAFSVNTMTGGDNTVIGGLVGTNGANLYNSYANVTMGSSNTATTLGGLVGINQTGCTVENCYVINPIGPAFAYTNNGNINFCYAADGTTNFVGADSQDPVGHGTYDVVLGRKDLGYMYFDNKVEKEVEADENDYITLEDTIYYNGGKIEKWRGLLSTLNQWVDSMNMAGSPLSSLVNENGSFTGWFRPTSDTINGDLPVLGFPKDNAMGTLSSDGKFLRYGSNVNGNGVDELLAYYDDNNEGDAEPKANIFHYGKATEVAEVPTSNVYVFINEDAVLKQAEGAGEFGNTTVGITFDNSCRNARDYYGNLLEYDWHFMSSSLSNAPMGATYGSATGYGGAVSITKLENNYFPNSGLTMGAGYEDGVKWDLYSYYEPEYHWINLKRGGDDHWHRDGSHEQIDYVSGQEGLDALQNETIFVPGKGYMMAISQDSYLSSTGTLNNGSSEAGGVQITLTNQEPLDPTYNKGWNLVGNPYQAYLDLTKVGTGTYYIYDADQNVYAPVTNGQSENPCIPSLYIHPHQGFFMYSSTDNNTITFDYADGATTSSETGSYFRGNEEKVNYPLVNLFAENQRGNRDLTVIELHRPELGGATKVMSMLNSNFQIAASLDGQNYGILFTPEGTERVPVRFKTEENGTFTLRWSTHNGDFTSLRLIDNITGVNYDMLANDHYTFEASTEDYTSRFYITYTCTGVDEEVTYDSDNFAFFDGSEWVVNGKGQLDVVDMTGRVLFTEQLNNEQNRVNLNGFAQGAYLMRVIDNKVVRTQKIIVR